MSRTISREQQKNEDHTRSRKRKIEDPVVLHSSFLRFLKMAHHQMNAVNEKTSTTARQLLKNMLTASRKSSIFRYLSFYLGNPVLIFSLPEASLFPLFKKNPEKSARTELF